MNFAGALVEMAIGCSGDPSMDAKPSPRLQI
jgi:hypothetical protein